MLDKSFFLEETIIIFGPLSLFGYILKGLVLNNHMTGYRILSLFQSIFSLFAVVSVLDEAVDFGMNEAFFGSSTSEWWSVFAFWAPATSGSCRRFHPSQNDTPTGTVVYLPRGIHSFDSPVPGHGSPPFTTDPLHYRNCGWRSGKTRSGTKENSGRQTWYLCGNLPCVDDLVQSNLVRGKSWKYFPDPFQQRPFLGSPE